MSSNRSDLYGDSGARNIRIRNKTFAQKTAHHVNMRTFCMPGRAVAGFQERGGFIEGKNYSATVRQGNQRS